MSERYLEATQEAGEKLFSHHIEGELVMLNLLRFRAIADYSATPNLAPIKNISGKDAYQRYIAHTLPHLRKSGGDIIFLGAAYSYLIGPQDERWDLAMLVRQKSLESFMAFSSNEEYLVGIGHRHAALEDSRLLPMVELEGHNITAVSI